MEELSVIITVYKAYGIGGLITLTLGGIIWNFLRGGRIAHWVGARVLLMVEEADAAREPAERMIAPYKAHEEMMHQMSSMILSLYEREDIGVSITNSDGEVWWVNRRLANWTGLMKTDFLGHGWAGIIHEEDVDFVEKAWAASQRDGRPFNREFRYRLRDDTVMPVHAIAYPMRADAIDASYESDVIVGWISFIEKVNDHRQSLGDLSDQVKELSEKIERDSDPKIKTSNIIEQLAEIEEAGGLKEWMANRKNSESGG